MLVPEASLFGFAAKQKSAKTGGCGVEWGHEEVPEIYRKLQLCILNQ